MNKIDRYLDSLLDLPTWIGLPIFIMSFVVPTGLAIGIFICLAVFVSPWLLLLPVVIWAACALNWWAKNKDK